MVPKAKEEALALPKAEVKAKALEVKKALLKGVPRLPEKVLPVTHVWAVWPQPCERSSRVPGGCQGQQAADRDSWEQSPGREVRINTLTRPDREQAACSCAPKGLLILMLGTA